MSATALTATMLAAGGLMAPAAFAWTPPKVTISGSSCGEAEALKAGSVATIEVVNVEDNVPAVLTSSPALNWNKTTLAFHESALGTLTLPSDGSGTVELTAKLTWPTDSASATVRVDYAPCPTDTTTTSTTAPSSSTTTTVHPSTTSTLATSSTSARVSSTTSPGQASTPCKDGTMVNENGVCALPVTGSSTGPIAGVAAGLLGLGALLVAASKRHALDR